MEVEEVVMEEVVMEAAERAAAARVMKDSSVVVIRQEAHRR